MCRMLVRPFRGVPRPIALWKGDGVVLRYYSKKKKLIFYDYCTRKIRRCLRTYIGSRFLTTREAWFHPNVKIFLFFICSCSHEMKYEIGNRRYEIGNRGSKLSKNLELRNVFNFFSPYESCMLFFIKTSYHNILCFDICVWNKAKSFKIKLSIDYYDMEQGRPYTFWDLRRNYILRPTITINK